MYRDRLLALPSRPPAVEPNPKFEPPAGLANLVADAAMVPTGDEATRWARYSGLYRAPAWGVLSLADPPGRFVVDAGVPYLEAEDETESIVRYRLAEVEPGLFLADNGETLDLGDRSRPGGTSGSFASRAGPPRGSGRSSGRPHSSPSHGWSPR